MTITFFEYGNTVMFNRRDLAAELGFWEEEIAVGDTVHYHDSEHGTRPLGRVVSVSPRRECLLLRLAGYERFVIVRKIAADEYIVLKSDISKMLETTGKRYYEGEASLHNVYWETDPDQRAHVVFLWYLIDERRLCADIVNLQDDEEDGHELVAYISGRYTLE